VTSPTQSAGGRLLTEVSNAMVALHKEQFGRGPTRARSYFAGPDILISVLDDVLLPAEHALVDLGEQQRVREQRLFMQVATRARFVEVIERIVGRSVASFVSASDPDRNLVVETCLLAPADGDGSLDGPGERLAGIPATCR
jgi:uncharacterized protein YbcI